MTPRAVFALAHGCTLRQLCPAADTQNAGKLGKTWLAGFVLPQLGPGEGQDEVLRSFALCRRWNQMLSAGKDTHLGK